MYIAQAYKFKHDGWRYVVGIIIVFLIGWQFLGAIPLTVVSFFQAENVSEFISASESGFAPLFPAKSNLYLLLMATPPKNDVFKKNLIKNGGMLKVPCLRVGSKKNQVEWIYESNEIIDFISREIRIPKI